MVDADDEKKSGPRAQAQAVPYLAVDLLDPAADSITGSGFPVGRDYPRSKYWEGVGWGANV